MCSVELWVSLTTISSLLYSSIYPDDQYLAEFLFDAEVWCTLYLLVFSGKLVLVSCTASMSTFLSCMILKASTLEQSHLPFVFQVAILSVWGFGVSAFLMELVPLLLPPFRFGVMSSCETLVTPFSLKVRLGFSGVLLFSSICNATA